jgi:DNA-binding GntR family transcriptional regulator
MSETLERDDPLYVRLYELYKGRIARGELAPGSQLPPVRQWERIHGVSVGTARQAVRLLAADKLVIPSGPHGTIVSADVSGPRLIFGPQERLGFAQPIPGERTEVSAAGMVKAPDYVAAILGLDEVPRHGFAPVYRREQKVYAPDGTPIRLEVSWFDPHWAEVLPILASETEPVPSLGGVAWLIAQADDGPGPIVKGVHGMETRDMMRDGREMPFFGITNTRVLPAVTGAVYKWRVRAAGGKLVTIEYGEYVLPKGRVIEHEYDVAEVGAVRYDASRDD